MYVVSARGVLTRKATLCCLLGSAAATRSVALGGSSDATGNLLFQLLPLQPEIGSPCYHHCNGESALPVTTIATGIRSSLLPRLQRGICSACYYHCNRNSLLPVTTTAAGNPHCNGKRAITVTTNATGNPPTTLHLPSRESPRRGTSGSVPGGHVLARLGPTVLRLLTCFQLVESAYSSTQPPPKTSMSNCKNMPRRIAEFPDFRSAGFPASLSLRVLRPSSSHTSRRFVLPTHRLFRSAPPFRCRTSRHPPPVRTVLGPPDLGRVRGLTDRWKTRCCRPALHVPCVHSLQGGPRGPHMLWDMPKYIAAAKGLPRLATNDVRGEPRLVARESMRRDHRDGRRRQPCHAHLLLSGRARSSPVVEPRARAVRLPTHACCARRCAS